MLENPERPHGMDFFSTEPGALRRQIFITALLAGLVWYTGAALDLSKWKVGIGAALNITQRHAISNGVLGIAFLVISTFLMVRAYFVFVAEIRMAGQKIGDLKKIVSDLADYSLAAHSCADAARELQRSIENLDRSLQQTPHIIEGALAELSVVEGIERTIKSHTIDQALFDVKGELAAWFTEMDREMALINQSISKACGLETKIPSRKVFQDSVIQHLRGPSEYSADILKMVDSVVRNWGDVLGPLEKITGSQDGLRNFALLRVTALNEKVKELQEGARKVEESKALILIVNDENGLSQARLGLKSLNRDAAFANIAAVLALLLSFALSMDMACSFFDLRDWLLRSVS